MEKMKTITNKIIKIGKGIVEYSNLIKDAIEIPQNGKSFTLDEVRKRIKILDKLEEGKGKNNWEFSFSKEEHEIIKNSVNNMKWGIAHKAIVEFVDCINES